MIFFEINYKEVMRNEYGTTESKEETAYKLYALRNGNPNDLHFIVPAIVNFYKIEENQNTLKTIKETYDLRELTEWASKNLKSKEEENIEKYLKDQKQWENKND